MFYRFVELENEILWYNWRLCGDAEGRAVQCCDFLCVFSAMPKAELCKIDLLSWKMRFYGVIGEFVAMEMKVKKCDAKGRAAFKGIFIDYLRKKRQK